jgi:hypothetical protein
MEDFVGVVRISDSKPEILTTEKVPLHRNSVEGLGVGTNLLPILKYLP